MHRQRFLLPALAVLTVWRLALLPTRELGPDEALALVAGYQSGWNFVEIGPLYTELVRAGTLVFGQNEFGVRFLAPLLVLIMSLCLWRLARGLFDANIAAWTVLAANVLPAVNLAAVSFTPGTVSLACVAGLALSLRIALHRTQWWHPGWLAAALCVAMAVLSDPRHLVALPAVTLALGLSKRRRHHLRRPGFWLIAATWAAATACWAAWQNQHGWPASSADFWTPCWTLGPSLLRWCILFSPLLMLAILWSLPLLAAESMSRPHFALLLGIMAPYAILDFGWGPWERWPDAGLAAWGVLALIPAAYFAQNQTRLGTRAKIIVRFAAIVLAACQSMAFMQTDWIRSLGADWSFAHRSERRKTYTRFLWSDPSANAMGWRSTAKVLRQVMSDRHLADDTWFVIANRWEIAAPVAHYAGDDLPVNRPTGRHPTIHVQQDLEHITPYSFWPRYDGATAFGSEYRGLNALYLTDDAGASQPPADLLRAFQRHEVLTVARIVHAGHKVRTLKIFACYQYHPPDF